MWTCVCRLWHVRHSRQVCTGVANALLSLRLDASATQCASKSVLTSVPDPCRVSPFDKDSPLKAMGVTRFPSDLFFVLRVVQLLRCAGT